MLETLLFFVHSALLLIFGILCTAAFSGIRPTRKNTALLFSLVALCGGAQIGVYVFCSEELVWKLYPLITHLPLVLLLRVYYRKPLISAFSAICTAYLCCQPAKWFGLLVYDLTQSAVAEYSLRILVLTLSGILAVIVLSPRLSEIFSKDRKSVLIFGITPIVYYLFDYATRIYARAWVWDNPVVLEFLPFFLCMVFTVFCYVYYKEYEQKADAERKEQILRITAQQQSREVETVRRNSQEVRLLRHDMRLFLSGLAVCIEDGNREKALEMISGYSSHIEGTRTEYFCENDTINYVLSDFAAKCDAHQVPFRYTVELSEFKLDELLFCSVLSNALDNALNAQLSLPEEQRQVKLMLKNSNGKLLLSVKNPVSQAPVFADGLPVTNRKNHGYGTQSIRFMAERIGGNCQFSMQDGLFVVRVIF